MKLLLDTQAFLWMVTNAPELSSKARRLAVASENLLYLSLASVWEMAIKISLGKLKLAEPIEAFITEQLLENNIRQLEISFRHAVRIADLPFHHRDPFDRLLVSQAQVEDLPILSADKVFDRYEVRRLW